ncbi:MAG: ABC transporter ATP-binding protein [Bacillati bacterium ANGP1]|uniref:ABC transporter ATP-binding protein n=1 Tax=Candidatus Segetimicrobium genomatis TaxID=2569760 RepID=A0A537KY56_9BACT|nr:MAG: ABC transporter ATP-binding protein [Terrabacteria group bacterium ANGP1]
MSTHFQEDEILGKAYDARLMRRLLRYVRPYRRAVTASIVLLLVAAAADLAGPYFVKVAIDRYIRIQDMSGVSVLSALYLGTLVVGAAVRYGQNYITQLVGQQVMYELRMEVFSHLQRLAVAFFARNPVGRLMTRITNDVDTLYEMVTSGVVTVFGDVFLLVGVVAAMVWLDWRLALLAFSVVPALVAMTLWFQARSRESYRAIRIRIARINADLNENIMGMSIVQLFNRERANAAQFDDLNRDHLTANLQAIRSFALFYPFVGFLGAVATALLIWYGGGRVVQQAVTLGVLVAFIQYTERFFRPIQDLAEKYNILQAAMASSERIFRVLDEPVTVQDPPDPVPLPRVRGQIEFQSVWFAYPATEPAGGGGRRGEPGEHRGATARGEPPPPEGTDGWVLRGVSFAIRPGESVAFVGHTGAGKTSIINLITRFYDPQRGQVLVDGVDIRHYAQRELRRHIGLVLQDVFLFSGTVASNIRLGNKEITDDEIRRAAEFVNANRFIEALPGGYATGVVERGATLSSGQRQLIAFARAVSHNPEILLVLDEATSSVDTETELLIQEALRKVLRGRTSIIIAHRLSTIQNVDRILVLHKGRIVEEGTHRELLARGGIYTKLYQLQYRDQEVRLPPAPAAEGASRDNGIRG